MEYIWWSLKLGWSCSGCRWSSFSGIDVLSDSQSFSNTGHFWGSWIAHLIILGWLTVQLVYKFPYGLPLTVLVIGNHCSASFIPVFMHVFQIFNLDLNNIAYIKLDISSYDWTVCILLFDVPEGMNFFFIQGRGNKSSGDNFHAAPNIDHSQEFVRKDLKEWLGWLRLKLEFHFLPPSSTHKKITKACIFLVWWCFCILFFPCQKLRWTQMDTYLLNIWFNTVAKVPLFCVKSLLKML